jgi:hypothetical protein
MPSIVSRRWAEAFAHEAGMGGEPPIENHGRLLDDSPIARVSAVGMRSWLATPTHHARVRVHSALPESRTHRPGGGLSGGSVQRSVEMGLKTYP